MIHNTRLKTLKHASVQDGDYLLYWMQQSQRVRSNAALAYAIDAANRQGLPLVVIFGLMDDYPEANLRHYAFMLQGLKEVEQALHAEGIRFIIRLGHPRDVAIEFARNASALVVDAGYLRHQKAWRADVAAAVSCPIVQVEADVVVPVEVASYKHESAARALRPKLHRVWDEYLVPLTARTIERSSNDLAIKSDVDLADIELTLARLNLDRSVGPVRRFTGGTSEALRLLAGFLEEKLRGYEHRNEPAAFRCSLLSPYLHFGQISPVEIALAARAASSAGERDRASFIEELIVRRELAINFCHYHPTYDRYDAILDWARKSLDEHRCDPREHNYHMAELIKAETHDAYWNAAMREMVETGFMHNYMRMYWAKKILEWSPTPEAAYATVLSLNNTYFLDGRDPNSFANVGWIFGLHDRAWFERPIFGKVRYMNANGLRRKFDMEAYIKAIDHLVQAERMDRA